MDNMITLPFKPFTIDEVQAITGIKAIILDAWVKDGILPMHLGDDRFTRGLNDSQMLGVFAAARYLEEGADLGRATKALELYVGTGIFKVKAWRDANTTKFAALMPSDTGPLSVWVDAPLDTRLGRALNSSVILGDFEHRMQRAFPK